MKRMMELYDQLGLEFQPDKKWGTDKLKKHPYYAEDYDNIFKDLRDKPIKLLEIGIYYGGSIILWDKYFPYGNVTGVDIEARNSIENVKDYIDHNRTKIVFGDAYSNDFAQQLDNFDIIIDDGPHTLESFNLFVDLYWPKINKDGFLVIEDVTELSWMFTLIEKLEKLGAYVEAIDYDVASDSRLIFAKKI